jgi:hypothetical protein
MGVSYTGDGLTVLISCDWIAQHDWMTFICWHSVQQSLPDSRLLLACNRTKMDCHMLTWAKRAGVPIMTNRAASQFNQADWARERFGIDGPIVVARPDVACVRDFDEAGFDKNSLDGTLLLDFSGDLCSPVKQENPTVFVNYRDGWGNFVPFEWINSVEPPLLARRDFGSVGMSSNEVRISRLWNSAALLYKTLSRG